MYEQGHALATGAPTRRMRGARSSGRTRRRGSRCAGSMQARGFGRIVNFASLYAYHPGPGQAPYAAAKAGIVGCTHSTAKDLAPHGVTANVLAPGLIWHERLRGVLPAAEYAGMEATTPMRRGAAGGDRRHGHVPALR